MVQFKHLAYTPKINNNKKQLFKSHRHLLSHRHAQPPWQVRDGCTTCHRRRRCLTGSRDASTPTPTIGPCSAGLRRCRCSRRNPVQSPISCQPRREKTSFCSVDVGCCHRGSFRPVMPGRSSPIASDAGHAAIFSCVRRHRHRWHRRWKLAACQGRRRATKEELLMQTTASLRPGGRQPPRTGRAEHGTVCTHITRYDSIHV